MENQPDDPTGSLYALCPGAGTSRPYVRSTSTAPCLGCSKRIPRWTTAGHLASPGSSAAQGCGQFYRRFPHSRVVQGRANVPGAKNEPILRAFLKPVLTIKSSPEYASCRGCGRTIRTELVFCNDRCRDYIRLSLRQAGWQMVRRRRTSRLLPPAVGWRSSPHQPPCRF